RLLSNRMHRTNSSWPSSTRRQVPYSMSHNLMTNRGEGELRERAWILSSYLMVLSELPLTTNRSRYWRQAIPRLWPLRVRTNSQSLVFHTLMVRSPEADTMYFSSKSTTLTAARWPTSTRRRLISMGDAISQTAIDRSLEQVTI